MRVTGVVALVTRVTVRVTEVFVRVTGVTVRVTGVIVQVSGVIVQVNEAIPRFTEVIVRIIEVTMRNKVNASYRCNRDLPKKLLLNDVTAGYRNLFQRWRQSTRDATISCPWSFPCFAMDLPSGSVAWFCMSCSYH